MITNNTGIPLTLAVWALYDDYDFINEPNYISATTLLKPIKQIILGRRVPPELKQADDVSDYVSAALGKSIHASVEIAWKQGYRTALKRLGYPESVIEHVAINPTPEEVKADPDIIPIYIEQRSTRTINGFKVGGKFDMVAEGALRDTKSTTAYTWLYGGKDDDYRIQGSVYRWLNPVIVTEDYMNVDFVFTDWQKSQAKQNPNYPQKRLESKVIALFSLEDTEKYIVNKLSQIRQLQDAPESQIPECTEEDLWRSTPQYKYYSDPTKVSGRSTRTFDDAIEAQRFMVEKGGKGVIITTPTVVKRCSYCPAFPICEQKDRYEHD